MINGLTAKWGIGDARKPPFWDTALIARYDIREAIEVDGVVTSIPNTATAAVKPGSLTNFKNVATENGSLVFNGVDSSASTWSFLFPTKFTMLWDIDWLGGTNSTSGIKQIGAVSVYNLNATDQVQIDLGDESTAKLMPNTVVGVSTDNFVYNRDGTRTELSTKVGTNRTPQRLYIGSRESGGTTIHTKMAFRSLYIFNRELTPPEMQEALAAMFS